MGRKNLNLGSGNDYFKSDSKIEWTNLEYDKRLKADIHFDLNTIGKKKLPFKDRTFDYVFFNHVIEHLSPSLNIMELINEISRVLKVGGILELNCPHYSGANAFGMMHTRYFNFRDFYSQSQFTVVQAGLHNTIKHWTTKTNHKRGFFSRTFNDLIEYLANLNPLLCERLWSHYVGGFIEMRFILKNKGTSLNKYDLIGVHS